MIIGLTGAKGSGKDTVAAYLIKEYGFERRAFADPLKRSLAALLDIPVWEVDKLKLDPTAYVSVGHINEPLDGPCICGRIKSTHGNPSFSCDAGGYQPIKRWSPNSDMTFREALQRYGTEAHRDIFGEDFWLDVTLPVDGFYAGRALVITDVRFHNEVIRIKDLGGIIAKIIRPALSEQDGHRSETELANLQPDLALINDGTIFDLYEKIDCTLPLIDRLGHV